MGDLLGGLAGAAVALPQSMGLGVGLFAAMGLGASAGALAGLIGAAALSLTSGIGGYTRGMISAPNGPVTMLLIASMATFQRSRGPECRVGGCGRGAGHARRADSTRHRAQRRRSADQVHSLPHGGWSGHRDRHSDDALAAATTAPRPRSAFTARLGMGARGNRGADLRCHQADATPAAQGPGRDRRAGGWLGRLPSGRGGSADADTRCLGRRCDTGTRCHSSRYQLGGAWRPTLGPAAACRHGTRGAGIHRLPGDRGGRGFIHRSPTRCPRRIGLPGHRSDVGWPVRWP